MLRFGLFVTFLAWPDCCCCLPGFVPSACVCYLLLQRMQLPCKVVVLLSPSCTSVISLLSSTSWYMLSLKKIFSVCLSHSSSSTFLPAPSPYRNLFIRKHITLLNKKQITSSASSRRKQITSSASSRKKQITSSASSRKKKQKKKKKTDILICFIS